MRNDDGDIIVMDTRKLFKQLEFDIDGCSRQTLVRDYRELVKDMLCENYNIEFVGSDNLSITVKVNVEI